MGTASLPGARLTGVLQGYRVIELTAWVAGPAAAGLLGEWGADVIKIEPPGGDPQRRVFGAIGVADQPAVPPFELDNRTKRSVVLDLATDEGKADLERLLGTADVLVTNYRTEALARLGLGADEVMARHPALVYAHITGYGRTGPESQRPGYDIGAFWARSGLAHSIVPPGEYPPPIRSAVGDHTTGVTLAAGILAALLERQRTGTGRLVSTSLLRAGIYVLGWDIGIMLRLGRLASTKPRLERKEPLLSCYRAGDGKLFWLIGLEGDRHWPGLLRAIERPELADDERFRTNRDRAQNARALIELLDEVFSSRPRAEWAAIFDVHDVWWAPVNSIAEVIEDPQAIAAGAFVDMVPREGEAPYKAVASPVDFGGWTPPLRQVPTVGEHTAEVLRDVRGEA
jgi:crotonobetainyl-CoA:carnitine CoA-transferase CaiB-like acyl-CoA transferase